MPTTTNSAPRKSLYDEAVETLHRELCDEKNRRRYLARKPIGASREDAEEALNETIVKLLREFNGYKDEKFKRFISNPASFIIRTFKNKAIDEGRDKDNKNSMPRSDYISSAGDDISPLSIFDDPVEHVLELERRKEQEVLDKCMRGIIECLAGRALTGKPKSTSITDKHLETETLFYRFGFQQNQIAEDLGVGGPEISKRLKHVRDTVRLTIYLAGALGQDGSIPVDESSYEACDRHLDAYEESLTKQDKARLLDAAPFLATKPDLGTRIIAEKYLAKIKNEDTDLNLSLLHDSETTYAKVVNNPFPRCVTVCQAHNPDGPNRPLEIAQ